MRRFTRFPLPGQNMSIERPVPADLRMGFWRDLSPAHAAAALVGFLFAATGPVAVILATGSRGGLAEADLASWVFGAFFINGIITIAFSLAYRQPLAFFWTIPGTVLVGPALGHFTMAEIVGAYIATGVLMLVLGVTGLVRRATEAVPMPIVMGMVAGVFLQFGLDWVRALDSGVWIAAPMTVAFLLVAAWPALAARLPPLLVALGVGAVAIWALGAFAPGLEQARYWASPVLHAPQLSWAAMLELVVPLAITVLVVQNGQGIAVLTAARHAPPTNAIAAACGVGAIASAFVGAVSTCLTGPVNAILSASGEKRSQYTAGVLVGVFAIVFGLLSPLFTRLLLAAPQAFIATLAGLAMLRVLQSAFTIAFQGRFTLGALVTFLVTVAGMPILNIGAPFWALVAGALVSLLLERAHWRPADANGV
jgi:benzoate membrane transport protein